MLDGPLPATGSIAPPPKVRNMTQIAAVVGAAGVLFLGSIGMVAGSYSSEDPVASTHHEVAVAPEAVELPVATPAPVVAVAAPKPVVPAKTAVAKVVAKKKTPAKAAAKKTIAKKSTAKKPTKVARR